MPEKFSSPMGNIISISPGTTITNATSGSTVFYSEAISAGSLIPNKWYRLKMAFKLTTPLINIPGISVSFQYGSSTPYTLMSSTSLVGSITNGLFMIDFTMISTSNTTQIAFVNIIQPNGTIITVGGGSVTPVGGFTTDAMITNNLTVSIQFTGIGIGTSKLENFWVFREPF